MIISILLSSVFLIVNVSEASTPIPVKNGTTWVYEGSVSWTLENSSIVKTANIRWVTDIVESLEISTYHLVVIRGFPTELCWYQPEQTPHLSLLIVSEDKIFHASISTDQEVQQVIRQFRRDPGSIIDTSKLLIDLPLKKNKRWGGNADRTDNMYCWYVEDVQESIPEIKGVTATSSLSVFTIIYRTNPDHLLMEFVPGIGIIRFVYEHHGTIASTDIHLIEFISITPDLP